MYCFTWPFWSNLTKDEPQAAKAKAEDEVCFTVCFSHFKWDFDAVQLCRLQLQKQKMKRSVPSWGAHTVCKSGM